MSEIKSDYNRNRGSTDSPNPQNQISASHKKIKQFYLPDDNQSEKIEKVTVLRTKILLIVKIG